MSSATSDGLSTSDRGAKYDVYDRELPYLYYNYSDKENKFTLTGLRLNVVYRFGHGRP